MADNSEYGVLVVEDDPAIRRLVTMVLQRQRYRVEVAADGLEAVLKLGLSDYDVIVLDLMMPNLDGFTFISTLNREAPERLRSIIVTSAASPAVIKERLEGKVFQLLPKPFDIQELVTSVQACIAAQEESRQVAP
ncbi:MAG TPA: response regulator [Thermoanaerobaculia bacterium]|nr:response regulator [Thermoanaerobaculia bacterium]